jgi:hypothetical protein
MDTKETLISFSCSNRFYHYAIAISPEASGKENSAIANKQSKSIAYSYELVSFFVEMQSRSYSMQIRCI